MSVTVVTPRQWKPRDILMSFRSRGDRAPGKLPAAYVDELMARRFGCVLICGGCSYKYHDGIMRHGYRPVPDVHAKGGCCDFCRQENVLTQAWSAEEKMRRIFMTKEDRTAERRREIAPWPRSFRDAPSPTRRIVTCTR